MSWRVVARKDVADAGRSRTLWLLTAALSALFVGYAVLHELAGEPTFVAFLDGLAGVVGFSLPVLAVVLGHRAIYDDRASGALLLVLSFPHSRRDLVVGTALGRVVVLLAPTLFALLVSGSVAAVRYGTDGAVLFPVFVVATVLYGAAFVGLSVALSMATTVERRLTYAAIGSYLVLVALWDSLVRALVSLLHRFDPTLSMPDWGLFLQLVQPDEAYYRLLRTVFDIERAGRYLGDGVPAYVDWWVALAVLLAWFALPLVIGYRRFESVDI